MIIIKIGGGKSINLHGIIEDCQSLKEKFIIIHGANALRDEVIKKLGISKSIVTSLSGYDSVLTDASMIDGMMMCYAGVRNKRIVELCHQHGINAVGLTGLDGSMFRGKRNKGIRTQENGKIILKHDLSGKPQECNTMLLRLLLEHDYTPVLTVPILDEYNMAINTENDDIVRILHNSIEANTIIQFIEAPGLLLNVDDKNSIVGSLIKEQLLHHEENTTGRMKRKLMALRKLYTYSSPHVIIADGRSDHPLDDAMGGKGTHIQ
jgi:[amino group carrier protein]-L-2-aminoadipate 6-kinase